MSEPVRIYVGAGQEAPEWSAQGWICNDLQEAADVYGASISLIGPCWALPIEDNSVDEIMSKGMLEHLTYAEVIRAFSEWRRVLQPGGFFTTEVPDLLEYFRQYALMRYSPLSYGNEGQEQAPGEPEDYEVCYGLDRWLRRALYGWQRYPGDEHRSGWTEPLLKFYLSKHFSDRFEVRRMAYSFEEDAPDAKMRHLWARAWK